MVDFELACPQKGGVGYPLYQSRSLLNNSFTVVTHGFVGGAMSGKGLARLAFRQNIRSLHSVSGMTSKTKVNWGRNPTLVSWWRKKIVCHSASFISKLQWALGMSSGVYCLPKLD